MAAAAAAGPSPGTRTASWSGAIVDLAAVLVVAARRSGPGFVSVYKGKGNGNLLRNRGMWCGLRALQANLSFKQTDLKKALMQTLTKVEKEWAAQFQMTSEDERKDWCGEIAKRIGKQGTFIREQLAKHGGSQKWLTELFDQTVPLEEPTEPKKKPAACGEEEDDDEEEEAEEEAEEETAEPTKKPAAAAAPAPAGEKMYLLGFDWTSKVAWRLPAGQDRAAREYVPVKLLTIQDKKVMATWHDKSTSFLLDVTEAELKEMQKADEGKCTHERFSLGEKAGALSCHLQNGGTAVKIFFWPPPPEGSEKVPKQQQVCQILTNIWSDLDPEKAQETALKMGKELINDIVQKKYNLETSKA